MELRFWQAATPPSRAPDQPRETLRKSCGNAGAVESVESQRQASHSFHEPLGNLATSRRDSQHSHSSDDEGGWKSGKPKAGFPLSHRPDPFFQNQDTTAGGLSPSACRVALGAASPATSRNSVTFSGEAT